MVDCHCEERAKRGTRQSIVSREVWTGLSVRVVMTSGSPRPQGARDDKSGVSALSLSLRGGQDGRRGNPSGYPGGAGVIMTVTSFRICFGILPRDRLPHTDG